MNRDIAEVMLKLETYDWKRSELDSTTYRKSWKRYGLKQTRFIDRRDIPLIARQPGFFDKIEEEVDKALEEKRAK